MYKLTDGETIELATFLRTLCRMGMLDDAKRVSKMSDGHLSILIQSEKLWDTVYSDAKDEKTAPLPRTTPLDFSRPSTLGQERK